MPAVAVDLAELLRQRGIQVTAQRLAVLRAVSSRPHVTADAVAESVRGEIGAISLQAVYDALGVLVAEGLIRRIQPAGSSARFEDRVGDNHHHLICRTCGRTVDVDCAVGFAPCLTAVDAKGYEVDEAEVVYWGRCPDCLGQSGRSKTLGPAEAGHYARCQTLSSTSNKENSSHEITGCIHYYTIRPLEGGTYEKQRSRQHE